MDFLELARSRYSVRNYESRKVEEEKLDKILEAGRVAPTACNLQPHRVLVIRSQEGLDKLRKAANIFNAELALLICGDHDNVWVRKFDNKKTIDTDAGIITDHMMMEAVSLGLGACWIAYFNPEVVREEFHLPSHYEPVNILTIGYPAGEPASPDRHKTNRKSKNEVFFYESF